MTTPEHGPRRAQPVSEQVDEATVTQLVLELETARGRAAQARLVAQAALVIAGFSIGAAVWAGSQASTAMTRAERIEQELRLSERTGTEQPTSPVRPRVYRPAPVATPTEPPTQGEPGGDAWMADAMLLEIEALEAELVRTNARLAAVEQGLVDWGDEAKRYVDDRLRRAPRGAPSPEARSAELTELWMRLQALEQQSGGR